MADNPNISIVVTSRNDDHGGDLSRRMRIFMNGLFAQAMKHKWHAELIVVEWNPPSDRPLLQEDMPKPAADCPMSLRYIIVPNEIHEKYESSHKLGLYQMIAKNVGIRRAKGEFVLCTNIDLLFSDPLVEYLVKEDLDPNAFYRVNRCDIPSYLDERLPFETQLKFCEDNIMRRLGYNPDYMYLQNQPEWIYKYPRYARWKNQQAFKKRDKNNWVEHRMRDLDMRACGDFTVMSKAAWEKIEGYPELDMYSLHVDSMGVIAASALGYKQVILPQDHCTYHIDHAEGWEAHGPLEALHFFLRKPSVDWNLVYAAGEHIIKEGVGFGINKPNWGWQDSEFEEFEF